MIAICVRRDRLRTELLARGRECLHSVTKRNVHHLICHRIKTVTLVGTVFHSNQSL